MPHADCTPWLRPHVERTLDLWIASGAQDPAAVPQFTPSEQGKRENAYDDGIRSVERELKHRPRTRAARTAAQDRIMGVFGRFATTALGLEDDAVQMITQDFLPVGTELGRWAQRFDPTMSKTDIVQACRNAWTAGGLQALLGRRTELTPSILAYSLMYPYTDNYIDCADVPAEAKSRFSARFRERLRGELAQPLNEREGALWTLVSLVEGEYPRQLYTQVFDSLLAIHSAQERSIAQLKNGGRSSDADVLEISCEKGGSSVLADAFLARGTLNEAESRFAFDWGVLLQLGDDLQDLRDDLRRDSATLFTRAVRRREPLDALVNQLLVFCDTVAAGMDELPHATPTLRGLLRMSWRSLIVEAVADAREYFTGPFLGELESTSPFRLKFLRSRHEKLAGRRGMFAALFDALVEAPDDEPSRLPLPEWPRVPVTFSS